jgi:hypothetical protein
MLTLFSNFLGERPHFCTNYMACSIIGLTNFYPTITLSLAQFIHASHTRIDEGISYEVAFHCGIEKLAPLNTNTIIPYSNLILHIVSH